MEAVTVTTYREAYRDRQWSLCGLHDRGERSAARERAGIGPLGPVTHGAHRGVCAVCEAEEGR